MSIIVRPEEITDLIQVRDLLYTTWLATYPNTDAGITEEDIHEFYKPRLTEEWHKKVAARFHEAHPNEHSFVAEIDGKIVGFMRIVLHPDKNQLQAIYVLPEYQRMGIGKLLWNKALSIFDGAKETIVQVATYNANAIHAYKKLGFTDTGKRFSDERFKMKSGNLIPEMEMSIPPNTLG